MYTSFFGFKENPFNLTPDPRYLFLSRYHKEALDHLLYGINERKGFIAITGGIGTGKTTLCRALLSHLHASTKSALILNSFISDMELLKAINQEFGIELCASPPMPTVCSKIWRRSTGPNRSRPCNASGSGVPRVRRSSFRSRDRARSSRSSQRDRTRFGARCS